MKALYFDGEKINYMQDYKKPKRSAGHSLVRVLVSAICNTDKEMVRGYRPDFTGVLGHEFVGTIEECDNIDWIGKRVVGEINEECGDCIYCNSGRTRHCLTRKVIGIDGLDGCFAEYLIMADHTLHEVPENVPTEIAVYTEPLAAALEIPSQIHIRPDINAAIIGDGRLALMIAEVMSLSGIDLTVIGKHPEKLELFKPYAKTKANNDETYEIVIEASGSPSGIELAKDIVRKQGTIVVKSTYAQNANIDFSYFVVNELTVIGSRCGPFAPALELLKKGLIKLPPVEFWQLKDYKQAFSSHAFKAGFDLRK